VTKPLQFYRVSFNFNILWWRERGDKVEGGCTTTNLSPSNGTEAVAIFELIRGEMTFTIFAIQEHDEQKVQKHQTFPSAA